MDRHRQRFLAKPAPHRVDVESRLDEQGANRMPQAVEGEARLHRAFPFKPPDCFDEGGIEAAFGPRRPIRCRRNRDRIV